MNQYIHQPPNVPAFMYASYERVWRDLISWAKKENVARLSWLSRHGYFLEFNRHVKDSSPVVLLATHPKFRAFCAKMTEGTWKRLSSKDKDMIINALNLREKMNRPITS